MFAIQNGKCETMNTALFAIQVKPTNCLFTLKSYLCWPNCLTIETKKVNNRGKGQDILKKNTQISRIVGARQ